VKEWGLSYLMLLLSAVRAFERSCIQDIHDKGAKLPLHYKILMYHFVWSFSLLHRYEKRNVDDNRTLVMINYCWPEKCVYHEWVFLKIFYSAYQRWNKWRQNKK
jgi:hypothetical protein